MDAKKGLAFSVGENQIRESFINFLLEEKEIPPDACVSAEIVNIKKHYLLFSKCKGPYTAHWSAKCIWERTEEYTYNDTEVVFVDKAGRQYSYQFDGTTPIPKQVTKTGYRNIIDRVEQVNREIKENYCKFIQAQGEVSPLYNWIADRFVKSKSAAVTLSAGDFSECTVAEQKNIGKVLRTAQTECKGACLSFVKSIIPGNKYSDFKFDFKSDFKISDEYYMPIYEVEYTYNRRQYEVWFSGYEKDVWFCDEIPKSSKIKSPQKASKALFIASASAFIIDIVIIIIVAIIGNSKPLSTMWFLLAIIVFLFAVFLICLIAGGILENTSLKNTERRDDIKNLLAQIYHNQEIPLKERKSEMERTVNEFGAKEAKFSGKRKKRILIPVISILIIVISALMIKQLILPTVKYNNAEKLLYSGQYSEAIEAFKNLGNFKDSESKVAEVYIAEENYVSAIEVYNELGNREKVEEYKPLAIDQQVAESKEVGRQAQIGNVITIGDYDAVVLDKKADRILVMVLRYNGDDSNRNLNTVYNMIYDYSSSSWKDSYIRLFLNTDFLDEFSESINRMVLEVDLPNSTQSGKKLASTKDKVFLLSAVSDKPYIEALIENGIIINSTMFTRTPAGDKSVVSVDVENNFDGTGNHYDIGEQDVSNSYYVRPCMWLDIS